MQESFRFINKHHSWITGHDFCDDARERLYAIARLINQLSGCVESDGVRMNTPLFNVVSWRSVRQPDAKLPQIGWIQNKMPTESIKYDSPHFVPLGVVSEKHLKTAFRDALKITSSLLVDEADATASIKHQC